jgi:hypothetical protein
LDFRAQTAFPPQAASSDELFGPFPEATCGFFSLIRFHGI